MLQPTKDRTTVIVEDNDLHVDVIIGGPPCQGFSNLGKKDPADLRNKLWSEFVRVVEHERQAV